MNRREFLSLGLPATGAVILSNSLLNQQAFAEISRQFDGQHLVNEYDIVINGAGFSGYFAALDAAKSGTKVLLVERRSSPGFEVAAKSNLWLDAGGFDSLPAEVRNLLLPEQEKQEIKNRAALTANSRLGNEISLFKGSIRKGMVRNLLLGKVDLMLMTDACGLFEDKGRVTGVLLATKQGVYSVKTKSFIDASDQLLFSRHLAGKKPEIAKAGFVLEVHKVANPVFRQLTVDSDFGLLDNRITVHPGKLSGDQAFLSFEYTTNTNDLQQIENKARSITGQLGARLRTLSPDFDKAIIQQYANEVSLTLADGSLPQTRLKGHYLIPPTTGALTPAGLQEIERAARKLVSTVRVNTRPGTPSGLVIVGKTLKMSDVRFREVVEPGFNIALKEVQLNWTNALTEKKQTQVVVAGGGTSGALAGAGSVDKGADTIVVDYFNDLGGTKTMGGVMGYYHGEKNNVFFKKQNDDAERLATDLNMTKKAGRQIYHLKALTDKGGQLLSSAIVCGAVVNASAVKGVVVCRYGKLELVLGEITIDATGDGDVAAFAGAEFQHGDSRIGYTQNYSQWDIAGVGKLPSNTNRDYDILDNRKVSEQQRGFLISHYEAHFYDFHPFLTVRESRRIDGVYNIDLIDCVEKRHFKDMLVLASSDFDPHNVASSEYSRCGFLLPHSNDIIVEIPYRSIVPKKLDGLLISGRGFGQSRNALQFTRMTADLLVLGYFTGQIAADIAWKKVLPREYDVSEIQKAWAALRYFPAQYLGKQPGDKRADRKEVERRVKQLESGAQEYLYECARVEKSLILPVLKDCFAQTNSKEGKLLTAKMLAWFGDASGNALIGEELALLFAEEQKEGYPNGYIDDYDSIRGREKNLLEGVFWKINQNISLLAMSGSGSEVAVVREILENTRSGGGMVPRTTDYFNERIDIRIIPFHNRILSLCMYAERVPDAGLITGLEKLLTDKNIGGFATGEYDKVRWRVYGGSLEISIAAALARCGSKRGYELLADYLDDMHFNYKTFALSELKEASEKDFGYDRAGWKKQIAGMQFPAALKALKKEVEV